MNFANNWFCLPSLRAPDPDSVRHNMWAALASKWEQTKYYANWTSRGFFSLTTHAPVLRGTWTEFKKARAELLFCSLNILFYLLCLRRRGSPVNYFQECECERRIKNSTIRSVSCFFSFNIFGINVWLGHLPLLSVSREFVFSVLRVWNLLKDRLTHKIHFELSATGSMLWKKSPSCTCLFHTVLIL